MTFFEVQMRNTQKWAFLDLFTHSDTANDKDIHKTGVAGGRTH